jgi:hypothetical protein
VPPGITRLPPAGGYDASPALAALLATVPADELGERFPGKMIGTIGQAGLNGAGDLAIYIGHTPAQFRRIPGTQWVTSISSAPAQAVFTPFLSASNSRVFGTGQHCWIRFSRYWQGALPSSVPPASEVGLCTLSVWTFRSYGDRK